jgi:8-oxo-dGTP diphosphatase
MSKSERKNQTGHTESGRRLSSGRAAEGKVGESHAGRKHPPAIIDVAAGLVFRDGKLLITLRYDDAHLGGLWEFPGGKVEPKESFEDCLVRELREELAIEVKIKELIETDTHAYPGKTVRLKFYRCSWTSGEPRALGCAAFKWVTAPELKEHEFPAADAVLLDRLRQEQSLWGS